MSLRTICFISCWHKQWLHHYFFLSIFFFHALKNASFVHYNLNINVITFFLNIKCNSIANLREYEGIFMTLQQLLAPLPRVTRHWVIQTSLSTLLTATNFYQQKRVSKHCFWKEKIPWRTSFSCTQFFCIKTQLKYFFSIQLYFQVRSCYFCNHITPVLCVIWSAESVSSWCDDTTANFLCLN